MAEHEDAGEGEWRMIGHPRAPSGLPESAGAAAELPWSIAGAAARNGAATLKAGARRSASALIGFGRTFLDFALPPTCIGCGAVVGQTGGLCGTCWSGLTLISRPYCERTGTPFAYDPGEALISPEALADPPAFDRARAAVVFDGVARDLVHKLKYADRLDLATPMARLMAQAGRELLADAQAHALVPVPLHPLRLWRRRFNQAALLARHISRLTGVPTETGLLGRRRRTPSQTALSKTERRANVAGAFAAHRDAAFPLAGARLILIDDVYTTGATLDACARALRQAGAAHVDALTFARVVEGA